MSSSNFEFLSVKRPELSGLAGLAESYVHSDPASAAIKLRMFAETAVKSIYALWKLPIGYRATFVDLLGNSAFEAIAPAVVRDKLHAIRREGNKAAHGELVSTQTVTWLLRESHDLARWIAVNFDKVDPTSLPAFQAPIALHDSKGLTKKTLEKLAIQEAKMTSLLEELDEARVKLTQSEERISGLELKVLSASASQSADILGFDEATTRKQIIDFMIAGAGWNVGAASKSTAEVAQEVEVDGQPTYTGKGYVDYVLMDVDGSALAVIEAKKAALDPEKGRQQAKLYADAIEAKSGLRPAIFYTNGYDLWFWDDAGGYPPRKVYGYYSKDSLQYLVKFQGRHRKDILNAAPAEHIVNRLYQIEAIKRVTERFSDRHRKALLVQATGTGKTRVAIALAELLIRTGWAKRVLFLCDRKELRKQAKNAFTNYLGSEPIRIVNSRASGKASERIFISTYPAMLGVYQSFDVGFFDLIIADESHRSIYNVYGELFQYFDCLQVGLTATPVSYVTRNTFGLFNCEGGNPTFSYDLEQAVGDRYLVPFEVIEHTTQFLREGIKLQGLSAGQIKELEDQGEDPNDYDFSSEQIDKAVFNRDTNREIIRNLMENGIRGADGQTLGKTIIFARNHAHALLLSRLFDEMYPQYGGKFCQVIDNYDPRAEQLIDDFKGGDESKNDLLTIAISVDMMDTGIDVPEILNLAFAKPVRSPVKFWQMVGRGTRLCPNLLGPGKHKTIFRIFDHWENFERFEQGYTPVEPQQSKSLLQRLFEERVTLAQTALQKSEIAVFNAVIKQIEADIQALPEESVAVREKWREKRSVGNSDNLKAFSPGTMSVLKQTIAPLMQWRNVRGKSEAYELDLLICKVQNAVLERSSDVADLKIDVLDRIASLQMHHNPVKDRADVIKRVKSDEFWTDPTYLDLEEVRTPLREIMQYRDVRASGVPGPKTVDVTEDLTLVETKRRGTSLKTVDLKAYEQLVEAELRKHFETDPTLQKIRQGEPVGKDDLNAIIALVLTQNSSVNREALEEFFASTTYPLDITLRSMVGLDESLVKQRFSAFAIKHPELSAKQTRFLALLQNHIIKFGFITIDKLYDQPFTGVGADGPEGIFDKPEDMDELMSVVNLFAPGGNETDTATSGKRTTH